jgi:hypothetical protein
MEIVQVSTMTGFTAYLTLTLCKFSDLLSGRMSLNFPPVLPQLLQESEETLDWAMISRVECDQMQRFSSIAIY